MQKRNVTIKDMELLKEVLGKRALLIKSNVDWFKVNKKVKDDKCKEI